MRSLSLAVERLNPWTNVYGIARSLLALSTLSSLALSGADPLFRPAGRELAELSIGGGINGFSLFSLLAGEQLEIARWIAIAILLVVISGWRPRLTGVLHWWIAFSYTVSAVPVEGGDQIIAVLTLLLIPVTLTDPRTWHWSAPPAVDDRLRFRLMALTAFSAFLVIRIQVAGIYFHAAIGKLNVDEWANGTALYYWLLNPTVGAGEWLHPLLLPVLSTTVGVMALTWSVLALETLLFMALVMEKKFWQPLLVAGLMFHFGIVFGHGLASFFFAMAGALVLYLRPVSHPFSANWLRAAREPGGSRADALRPSPVGSAPAGGPTFEPAVSRV